MLFSFEIISAVLCPVSLDRTSIPLLQVKVKLSVILPILREKVSRSAHVTLIELAVIAALVFPPIRRQASLLVVQPLAVIRGPVLPDIATFALFDSPDILPFELSFARPVLLPMAILQVVFPTAFVVAAVLVFELALAIAHVILEGA